MICQLLLSFEYPIIISMSFFLVFPMTFLRHPFPSTPYPFTNIGQGQGDRTPIPRWLPGRCLWIATETRSRVRHHRPQRRSGPNRRSVSHRLPRPSANAAISPATICSPRECPTWAICTPTAVHGPTCDGHAGISPTTNVCPTATRLPSATTRLRTTTSTGLRTTTPTGLRSPAGIYHPWASTGTATVLRTPRSAAHATAHAGTTAVLHPQRTGVCDRTSGTVTVRRGVDGGVRWRSEMEE